VSRSLRTALVVLGLLGLTLAVHEGVRHAEFLHYDDDLFVTNNPFVRQGLTPRSLRWAFEADLVYETPYLDYWAPLTVLTRLVDVQVHGMSPAGHHLTNLLLHALNVGLAFLALRALTGALWPSAFVAAVMAVHPLHVEPVAWVAARKDMVSGVFWMAGLGAYAAYARAPSRRRYALLLFTFLCGLLSKPMVLTFPFVLLLLDHWPLRRPLGWPARVREKAPLFLLTAASVLVTYRANMNVSLVPTGALPLWVRFANAAEAYAGYLGHALWPAGLGVGYPHVAGSLTAGSLAVSVAALLAVSVWAVAARNRQPWVIVGWCWFLGMVLPTVGIVQSGVQNRADRYAYLPLMGLSLAVAFTVARWVESRPRLRRAAFGLGALAVLALAVVSHRQIRFWKDDMTLFSRSIEVIEGNAISHNGRGAAFLRAGDAAKAEADFREALRLKPDFIGVVRNLTLLLLPQGRFAEAESLARDGLLRFALPGSRAASELHFDLALVRARQGRAAEAEAEYREVLALNPYNWAALYNWGNLLVAAGRLEDAETRYRDAHRLNRDDVGVAGNLGLVVLLRGRAGEAVALLEEAIAIDPGNGPLRTKLGRCLVAAGRHADGVAALREGVRLAARNPDAHFQLAVALEAAGATAEAAARYEEALRLDPGDEAARGRLFALRTKPD
jgi:Flp pilus assembly protein TadD